MGRKAIYTPEEKKARIAASKRLSYERFMERVANGDPDALQSHNKRRQNTRDWIKSRSKDAAAGDLSSSIKLACNSRKYSTDRKCEFNITHEFCEQLYHAQNGKCALTGEDLVFTVGDIRRMSLDRIDSSKGYVPGNVQWVHTIINRMKNVLTTEELIHYCKMIVAHSETCNKTVI